MAKKQTITSDFDFDLYVSRTLEQAEKGGISENITFKAIFNEFVRMKHICDRLYEAIEADDVYKEAMGSRKQEVFKSNPLTKDYINAHKTLVSTATSLQKFLDNVKTKDEEEDDYAL